LWRRWGNKKENIMGCNIFELLYFISGVVIAITAIVALRQLKITKETLTTNSQRDAIRITAEQCENYLKNINPLHLELNEQIEKNNIKCFDGWKVEIIHNTINIFHPSENVKNDAQPVIDLIFNILDTTEAFSNYFIFGLADQEKAYRTIGYSYIANIEKLMPILNCIDNSGYYRSTIDLFAMWKNEYEKNVLYQKKNEIDEELSVKPVNYIKPIGV
jgi:hypothetical protein